MILASVVSNAAEEETSGDSGSKVDFFALPIELDMDSGATNGYANIRLWRPLDSIARGEIMLPSDFETLRSSTFQ